MNIPESLLEIRAHSGSGFSPLVDFGGWRVALYRASSAQPQPIESVQRHFETDEVFVLLEGASVLAVGEGSEAPASFHAQKLEPGTLYNVKRGAWHAHTETPGTLLLIVENRDTSAANSETVRLSAAQRQSLESIMRL